MAIPFTCLIQYHIGNFIQCKHTDTDRQTPIYTDTLGVEIQGEATERQEGQRVRMNTKYKRGTKLL